MSGSVSVTASLKAGTSPAPVMEMPMVEIEHLSLWYGTKLALKDISMSVPKHRVTAYIGPSGCGKSTLLRCLNRMNDLVDGVRIAGNIRIGGTDIHDPSLDVTELRKRVGMVFQKSNPFPKSIFENVAYGPRILGTSNQTDLEGIVERSLKGAALWDQRFRFETIEDRALAPQLIGVAAVNSLLESGGAGSNQTVRWKLDLFRRGAPPLVLTDLAAGDAPIPEVGGAIASPLRTLLPRSALLRYLPVRKPLASA